MASPCAHMGLTSEVADCIAGEISALRKELRDDLLQELGHELRATEKAMRGELCILGECLIEERSRVESLYEELRRQASDTTAQPVCRQVTWPKSAAPGRQKLEARRCFGMTSSSGSDASTTDFRKTLSSGSDASTTDGGSVSESSGRPSLCSSVDSHASDVAAGSKLPPVRVADVYKAEEPQVPSLRHNLTARRAQLSDEDYPRQFSDEARSSRSAGTGWDAAPVVFTPQPPAAQFSRRTCSTPASRGRRPGGASAFSACGPDVAAARQQIRSERDGLEELKLFKLHMGSLRGHIAGISLADDTSFMEPDHPMRSPLH